MPTRNLEDDDHLLRHVPRKHLAEDPATGALTLFAEAFRPRQGETSLSAAWIEFHRDEPDPAASAMDDLGATRQIKPKDRFATGSVSAVRQAFQAEGVKPRIVHDGEGYPSHAAVRQIDRAPDTAYERLAMDAWASLSTPTDDCILLSGVKAGARRARSE